VHGGGLVVEAVDDGVERLARKPLERGQRVVLAPASEVDLGAEAGREADRVVEVGRQRGRAVEVERDPLAQLDRSDAVGEADD
jgi:hypothetical protein